jgi:hypothetical protein
MTCLQSADAGMAMKALEVSKFIDRSLNLTRPSIDAVQHQSMLARAGFIAFVQLESCNISQSS